MFPGSRAGTHVGFKLSRSTHLHEDTNGKLNIPNVRFVIYVQLISLTVIHPQERSSWISSSLKWRNNSPIVNCWRSWVPNLKLPVAHFLKFTIRRASVNRKVSPNERNPIRYPSGFKSLIYVNVQILELISHEQSLMDNLSSPANWQSGVCSQLSQLKTGEWYGANPKTQASAGRVVCDHLTKYYQLTKHDIVPRWTCWRNLQLDRNHRPKKNVVSNLAEQILLVVYCILSTLMSYQLNYKVNMCKGYVFITLTIPDPHYNHI